MGMIQRCGPADWRLKRCGPNDWRLKQCAGPCTACGADIPFTLTIAVSGLSLCWSSCSDIGGSQSELVELLSGALNGIWSLPWPRTGGDGCDVTKDIATVRVRQWDAPDCSGNVIFDQTSTINLRINLAAPIPPFAGVWTGFVEHLGGGTHELFRASGTHGSCMTFVPGYNVRTCVPCIGKGGTMTLSRIP